MSADPITEQLSGALDSTYDAQYEFYLATTDTELYTSVEVGSQFQIADMASADWAVRKIRKAEQMMAEVDEATNVQVAAIMAKADELCAPLLAHQQSEDDTHEQTVRFFTALLNTYHRKLLAEDPDRKTIKLAFGTLSARKLPDSWEFDSAAFLPWCQESDRKDLLRIKVEPNVAEAKRVLTTTPDEPYALCDGEVVPGVIVTPGEVRFSVSTEVAK